MFHRFFKTAFSLMNQPKALPHAARVTPTIAPLNPAYGMNLKKKVPSINTFGTTARKGLVSRTAAVTGTKIAAAHRTGRALGTAAGVHMAFSGFFGPKTRMKRVKLVKTAELFPYMNKKTPGEKYVNPAPVGVPAGAAALAASVLGNKLVKNTDLHVNPLLMGLGTVVGAAWGRHSRNKRLGLKEPK